MRKTPFAFDLLLFSCLLFLFLTTLGMFTYPGGTILDHYTKGYSFFNNFFSELGRWRTHLGETKWVSFYVFTIALLFHAVAMFVFNWHFLHHTASQQLSKGAHYTALVSGSVFPFFLAGIALTPADLYLSYHMFCVRVGFAFLLPLSLAYTILIRKHHMLPNRFGNVMLTIVIAIGIYLGMLFAGPSPREVPFIQQTAQKIIVYSMIFSLLYLGYGCRKYLKLDS